MSSEKNRLLIFGRSPFILTIEAFIPALIDKYPSVGINSFVEHYNPQWWAFLDKPHFRPKKKDITAITCPVMAKFIENEGYKIETYKRGFDNAQIYDKRNNILLDYGYTHDFVISWGIKEGYKEIILIGTADFIDEGRHFDDNNPAKFGHYWTSIKGIEEVYSKNVIIKTLNNNSLLNIPRITMEELTNGHTDRADCSIRD